MHRVWLCCPGPILRGYSSPWELIGLFGNITVFVLKWGSSYPAVSENHCVVTDTPKSVGSETLAFSSFLILPGAGVHKKEPIQSSTSAPGRHSNSGDAPTLWSRPYSQCAHRKDQLNPLLLPLPAPLPS